MLIAAAARTWKVSPAQCRARDSVVFHAASGRRATYGELAAITAGVPVPNTARLTDTFDFRVIGKSVPRLDTPAKVDGSIVFGLTAALKGQITIRDGRVEQSNFHDYPILRMDEMPRVDTYILPSKAEPGGVGKPVVPSLAPALANAVHTATGKRILYLPIVSGDLR